jgi:hypothetical protein
LPISWPVHFLYFSKKMKKERKMSYFQSFMKKNEFYGCKRKKKGSSPVRSAIFQNSLKINARNARILVSLVRNALK